MSQLSAYNLLEGFSKQQEVQIESYRVNFLKQVSILEINLVQSEICQNGVIDNKFLSKHLYTCNSFIQRKLQSSYQTEIATMGVPFAPQLNEIEFQNQDQVLNFITKNNLKDSFTIQEIQHNSNTVCISFCNELDSFCISYGTKTIVCYNQKEINLYKEPYYKKPREAATLFFNWFNKIPRRLQDSFIKDLIDRSLIGCFNVEKQIEWFAIVEHYSEQRLLDPSTVQEFLNYYKLESAQIIQTQSSQIQLKKHFQQIYKQLIEQFNGYYKGKTLYFWKQNKFHGCCFIPFKQYTILNQLRTILKNKETNLNNLEPYQYLVQFNLNESDQVFYRKYTDLMLEIPETIQNKKQFSELSTQAFNSINEDLDYLAKKQENLQYLSSCFQQTIIVVIPLGILGMGYEKLCTFIQKKGKGVQIIKIIDEINEKNQLYFLDKVCNLKELEQINKQLKLLPFNIKTIALLPQCYNPYYRKEYDISFPFSFNFIMFCLISVLDDNKKVKVVINQLKEFKDQKFNNIPTDYKIYCRFIPENKENDDLYSELVEQDFQAALQSQNDQLIESLSQYKETLKSFADDHLKKESKRVIEAIESKSKVTFRKIVKFQFEKAKQVKQGLFIEKPNWQEIDNFIKSCIEIISQNYPQETIINRMYHDYDRQFKNSNAVFMKRNKPYIQVNQLYNKSFDTKVSIAVVIADGIIILYPQDIGLDILQEIPIYSYNIDILISNKVSEQVKIEVKKMQKQNIEEKTVILKQITLNNKNQNAYIVKFSPFNIKLVSRLINQ